MSTNSIWMTKTLGQILKDIRDGGTPNTNNKEYFDGAIPWVVIQDIKKEITNTKTTLTEQGLKSCSANLWPAGTIILSTGATIGEVGIAQKPLATKQGIHGLVCGKEIESKFLFYQIQTLRNYLKANAQGSTIREIRAPFLKTIPINFPKSKPEQSKIAEVLTKVDQAIEQTESLIAKQQRIKTGLMQDLLTRGIDEHGNLRSEETHELKDSPLGRIPVEWEVDVLNSKAIVKGGKRLPSGHNYAEGSTGFRYLKTIDFIGKILDYASLSYLFPKTFNILERYEIVDSDVFISIAGVNLGVAGVFRSTITDKTILTENAAKIKLLGDNIPEYLSIQINGPVIQKQILESKGVGAGVPKLALCRIQQLNTPWPNHNEQLLIVEKLLKFENAMIEQEQSLSKLRSLKTALMQDLLTGKKRVTPLMEKMEASI